MSRHTLGWSYPAGAEFDPQAPWNQKDDPREDWCDECDTEQPAGSTMHLVDDGPWDKHVCECCLQEGMKVRENWTVKARYPARGDV